MKLKDINFKNPNHPFVLDIIKNYQTEAGDELACIKCEAKYKRGFYDFYSLCDKCFYLFDKQKMEGRFSKFLEGNKDARYFEDPYTWIAEKKKDSKATS